MQLRILPKKGAITRSNARTSMELAVRAIELLYRNREHLLTISSPESKEEGVELIRKTMFSLNQRKRPTFTSNARMIWAPDPEEKAKQAVWAKRLSRIPMHQQAWGFIKGRSCIGACRSHLTYWNVSGPGQMSLLTMDMENFFPSVRDSHIISALLAHGFSQAEATECMRDCTVQVSQDWIKNVVFREIWRFLTKNGTAPFGPIFGVRTAGAPGSDGPVVNEVVINEAGEFLLQATTGFIGKVGGKRREVIPELKAAAKELLFRYICGVSPDINLGDRVLAQGSPAAPALSNLSAKLLDYKLHGLAKKVDCFYTRYADDITFSWGARKTAKRIRLIAWMIDRVVKGSGFRINARKTCIKGPGMAQSMLGYNLNSGNVTISKTYRSSVRQQLRLMMADSSKFDHEKLDTLIGQIEFIAQVHPGEAEELREMAANISAVNWGLERGVIDFSHIRDHALDPEDLAPYLMEDNRVIHA